MEYTKEKWRIVKIKHRLPEIWTENNLKRICTVSAGWTDGTMLPGTQIKKDEMTANAKLIAAAPDLLEALEVAKKYVVAYDKIPGYESHPSVMFQINEALKKAKS